MDILRLLIHLKSKSTFFLFSFFLSFPSLSSSRIDYSNIAPVPTTATRRRVLRHVGCSSGSREPMASVRDHAYGVGLLALVRSSVGVHDSGYHQLWKRRCVTHEPWNGVELLSLRATLGRNAGNTVWCVRLKMRAHACTRAHVRMCVCVCSVLLWYAPA